MRLGRSAAYAHQRDIDERTDRELRDNRVTEDIRDMTKELSELAIIRLCSHTAVVCSRIGNILALMLNQIIKRPNAEVTSRDFAPRAPRAAHPVMALWKR
jgi:hypothetical protein